MKIAGHQNIVKKDQAEGLAVEYSPKPFPFQYSKPAVEFVQYSEASGGKSSFRIDRLVAKQTGVDELERLSIDERVDREALLRLEEIKGLAYEQAYQLGLQEGRAKAYEETMEGLVQDLGHLDQLMTNIRSLKSDLMSFNESHILRLIFFVAKRLAFQELKNNPEIVLQVVRQALEEAQVEEKMVIQVSPKDFDFIQSSLAKIVEEHEYLKTAKFESAEDIKPGGCRIHTNYGEIDATIEQRVERLWHAVGEKLPRVEDKLEPGGS